MKTERRIPNNPVGTKWDNRKDFFTETSSYIDKRLFKLWRDRGDDNLKFMRQFDNDRKFNAHDDMGILKGEKVALVAKGPSTFTEIEKGTLQEFSKKHKIIAVNVVAEDLVKAGIKPWAVIAMDLIAPPVKDLDCKLYSCIKTNIELVKNWKGDDIKFFIAGVYSQDNKMPANYNARWLVERQTGMEHGKDFKIVYVDCNDEKVFRCIGKNGQESYVLENIKEHDTTNGVYPVDMPVWKALMFKKVKTKGTSTKKRKEFFVPDVVAWPGLSINQLPMLPIGGNVASGALILLTTILGASEVVLVGHDYCMYDTADYGNTDKDYRKKWEFEVTLDNEDGKNVLTNLNYYRFALWTEDQLKGLQEAGAPFRVVNTTLDGLFGNKRLDNDWKRPPGMEHKSLAEVNMED